MERGGTPTGSPVTAATGSAPRSTSPGRLAEAGFFCFLVGGLFADVCGHWAVGLLCLVGAVGECGVWRERRRQ